jgi:peptidoglycan/xylan/chitin deacetylase (PgdA/CDA1 family)
MKAALSLDLDNQWSYMKTHGDPGWESYPSYLDMLVPRVLEILERQRLRITCFIVGLDAAMESNAAALAALAQAGHEIGNHSHYHEPWLHRRPEEEIEKEIAEAEESIRRATGRLTRGFRGPGFVNSQAIFRILARRGYVYDASTLPTFIGPLARAYYFRSAKLAPDALNERGDLYGSVRDALLPNRPYTIITPEGVIQEFPVTTMPGLRIPIHVSYLLYIAAYSEALALAYFRAALELCRITGTPPSILLHPLDFLGRNDCPALQFFPAMNLDGARKLRFVERVIAMLTRFFEVCPLIDAAAENFTGSSQDYEVVGRSE